MALSGRTSIHSPTVTHRKVCNQSSCTSILNGRPTIIYYHYLKLIHGVPSRFHQQPNHAVAQMQSNFKSHDRARPRPFMGMLSELENDPRELIINDLLTCSGTERGIPRYRGPQNCVTTVKSTIQILQ